MNYLMSCLLFLVLACSPQKSETVVYVIRHAEKDLTNPDDKDPPLTPEGYARAEKLVQQLDGVEVNAVYSTPLQRSRNTIKPLSEKYKLPIQPYTWHQNEATAKTILDKHRGQTVVLCGHQDNILPLIEKLGAKPPMQKIGAEEYDKLFKVTIPETGAATATVTTYN